MSCMMSSPELLSALAESVEYIGNGNYDAIGFEMPYKLAEALSDCRDYYGAYIGNEIYKRLYALNAAAYNSHWDESTAPAEAPDRPAGKRLLPGLADHTGGPGGHFVVTALHYDLARALDFFNYQCVEDATDEDPLARGMRALAGNVTRFIVQNSEEYNAGRWGEL